MASQKPVILNPASAAKLRETPKSKRDNGTLVLVGKQVAAIDDIGRWAEVTRIDLSNNLLTRLKV